MARRRRKKPQEKKKVPSKGSRKRRLIIGLSVTTLLLILAPIITFYQVFSWLQSESFRIKLEEIVKDKAQANKVSIAGKLQINDDQVSMQAIDLERADIIEHAAARRIVAHIERSKLLDRELSITKLTMEEAALQLNANDMDEPLPPIKKDEGGLLKKFAPEKAQLHSFECKDADIVLLTGEKRYSLTGGNITATPLTPNQMEEWQVTVENGRVRTPLSYLLTSNIKTATLFRTKETTELTECRFMLTPGELRMKGSMQNDTKNWVAILRANKANVARLLSDDWKKRLTGEIYGDLKLVGTGTTIKEAGGNISLQRGVLEALPILSDFCLAGTKGYRSIHLEKAVCRISFPYADSLYNIKNAWLFDQIDLRSKDGNLRVLGHVIVGSDGALRGTLTVGLTETIASAFSAVSADATSRIFNVEGEAGYQWLNINLSGTIDDPQEDLSARVQTVLAGTMKRAVTETVTSTARATGSMFDTFVKRSQEIMDAAAEEDEKPSSEAEKEPPSKAKKDNEAPVKARPDKTKQKKKADKNKNKKKKTSAADAFDDEWEDKPQRNKKDKSKGAVPGATDVLDLFF